MGPILSNLKTHYLIQNQAFFVKCAGKGMKKLIKDTVFGHMLLQHDEGLH